MFYHQIGIRTGGSEAEEKRSVNGFRRRGRVGALRRSESRPGHQIKILNLLVGDFLFLVLSGIRNDLQTLRMKRAKSLGERSSGPFDSRRGESRPGHQIKTPSSLEGGVFVLSSDRDSNRRERSGRKAFGERFSPTWACRRVAP